MLTIIGYKIMGCRGATENRRGCRLACNQSREHHRTGEKKFPIHNILVNASFQQSSPLRRAFYLLWASQIMHPSFPCSVCVNNGIGPLGKLCVDLRSYAGGVIVVQPQNITKEHVLRVRAAVPRVKLLAYMGAHLVSLLPRDSSCPHCDGSTVGQDIGGRNCTNGYSCSLLPEKGFAAAIREAFPSRFAARLSNGTLVNPKYYQPNMGQAVWIPSQWTADAMGKLYGTWMPQLGLDGMYVDGYIGTHRAEMEVRPRWIIGGVDFDGDGLVETADEAFAQYKQWMPELILTIRSVWHKTSDQQPIIIANSAGRNDDPLLDGITVESEYCKKGGDCGFHRNISTFDSSIKRLYNILWLTHAEVHDPVLQCQFASNLIQRTSSMIIGTDAFDRSLIHCGASTMPSTDCQPKREARPPPLPKSTPFLPQLC